MSTVWIPNKSRCVSTRHRYEGLPGVLSIADDITVYGKDEQEHDRNLHLLMQRARERGLVFNASKCDIKPDFRDTVLQQHL